MGAKTTSPDENEIEAEVMDTPTPSALARSVAEVEAVTKAIPYQELEAYIQHRVDSVAELCLRLRARAIQATQPQDWTKMGDSYYLQDAGCQRAGAPWGIEFDKVNLATDLIREEETDGHITYVCSVMARCHQLGITRGEIGSRSTSGDFYRKAWENPDAKPSEKKAILDNVRKAALANARGRCVRALTGLNSVSREELEKHIAIGKVGEVKFRKGSRGGTSGTNEASEAQLTFAFKLAVTQGRCPDAPRREEANVFYDAALLQKSAQKKAVSGFLDACQQDPEFRLSWGEFVHTIIGNPKLAEAPPEGGEE